MQLAQCTDPVVEVVQHEGEDHEVLAVVGQPGQRLGQSSDAYVSVCAETLTGQAHHLGALVERGDLRATGEELLGVQTRAATRVENPQTRHVARQGEHRRTVAESVVGAGLCVHGEVVREGVVLARRAGARLVARHGCPRAADGELEA